MMKVLFVVSTFPSHHYPNIGAFNVRAAKQIDKFCCIKVIKLRSWKPGRKLKGQYNFDSFNVINISLPYLALKMPGGLLAIITGIYKYLSFYILKNVISQYDVIHSVGLDLPGIVCSYWAKRQNKIHIAQAVGTDINYRIGLIKKYPGVRGWEKSINYLVGNSLSLVREFHKHYPDFPESKTAVVYRGVDLTEFIYTELKNIHSNLIFLYLGGISHISAPVHGMNFKGILTLVEAWDLLLKNFQHIPTSIKLYIGGPNTEKNLFILERIKSIQGSSQIEIIGSLTSDEVKDYMQKSAVIIIPSMAEGLPNVAMEAAATGRPVIASRVGGIPELVVHNKTGLLFEAGNIQDLTNCMKQFIDNPELIKQYGINARKRVVEHFDSNQFAKYYIKLYES